MDKLGSGSTGVVYRAIDENLRRPVALKILPAELAFDGTGRARLLREARAAAAITHPNIATIFEVGEDGGRTYIAMELVDGESLRERLLRGRPSIAEATTIGLQVARGLGAAHDKGFVHRDLKPENVMITPDGVVKVLDFGLAKGLLDVVASELGRPDTGAQMTVEGVLLGTPAYMSPEQALGERVGVASDVFSLGVVLYEMLAGARPFTGVTLQQLLVAIVRDTPAPLREASPEIDPELAAVVMRCLSKDVASRFANGSQVAQQLADSMSEPPSPPRRSPRVGELTAPRGRSSLVAPPGVRSRATRMSLGAAAIGVLVPVALWSLRGSEPRVVTPSVVPQPSASAALPRARALAASSGDNVTVAAALSPDASLVCFVDAEGFWLQPTDGGARQRLGIPHRPGDEARLFFFPDGRRVLASVGQYGRRTNWIAAVDGSPGERQAERLGDVVGLSPDGTRVVVATADTLELHDLTGARLLTLAPTVKGHWIAPVRFSPDGQKIAYVDGHDLRVTSIDGATTQRLMVEPRLNMGGLSTLAWPSPDRILFGSNAGERGSVSVGEIHVDQEGRPIAPARTIWTGRGVALDSLTTAGDRMAFILIDSEAGISVGSLHGSESLATALSTQLLSADQPESEPAIGWIPDGRVVFVANDRSVHARSMQGSDGARLAAARSLLEVLRTGAIVYARDAEDMPGGSARVFIKASDQAEVALSLWAGNTPLLRCAAGDPARCVLAGAGTSQSLSLVNLRTERPWRPPVDAPCETVRNVDVAPAGNSVAVICMDGSVQLVDTRTAVHETLAVHPALTFQSLSFAPDGKSLYLTGVNGETASFGLVESDLQGHGRLLAGSNSRWFYSPRVSPDGKSLAVAERVYRTSLWLLEPR